MKQPGRQISVVLIDEQTLFAQALEAALTLRSDLSVIATAPTAGAGVTTVERLQPDVVLMASTLPDADGAEAVGKLLERAPRANVMLVSAIASTDAIARAVEAGAVGFVSKRAGLDDLVEAVRRAAEGSVVLEPTLFRDVATYLRERGRRDATALTEREDEVLQLLASGWAPSRIAAELGVTLNTARNHVRAVRTKLDATTQLEAVAIAYRTGRVRGIPEP